MFVLNYPRESEKFKNGESTFHSFMQVWSAKLTNLVMVIKTTSYISSAPIKNFLCHSMVRFTHFQYRITIKKTKLLVKIYKSHTNFMYKWPYKSQDYILIWTTATYAWITVKYQAMPKEKPMSMPPTIMKWKWDLKLWKLGCLHILKNTNLRLKNTSRL